MNYSNVNFEMNYLLEHIDLWLWDWDDTLIDTKSYYINKMIRNEIMNKKDLELDRGSMLRYFVNLVHFLKNNGKQVGIVSFGTDKIIQAYMDRMFGKNNPFDKKNENILTIKRNKNHEILEIKEDKNDFINIL